MKNIFYILLLLPTIIFAQYPSNSGQKITLGEQTTADGLVFRGRASIDTLTATNKITRANKQDTSAFLLLDTTTNLLWHYKTGSNGWIQAGGSTFDTTTLNLVSRFALKLNISDTASMLTPYWRSGRFSGVLPVANGGTNASTFTEGSVVFAGASGTYTQDNSGLFYDNTNDRLGIGTASPSDKLTVSGSIRLTSTLFANTQTNNTVLSSSDATNIANGFNLLGSSSYWGIRTLASGDLSLDVFNSFNPKSALYIANNGNVGIGTASPTALLSIKRGASGDNMEFIGSGGSGYSDILFYNTDKAARLGYIDWSNTQVRFNVEANIPLAFHTNTIERMRITNAGNVGIGTASPTEKLHVVGNGLFTGTVTATRFNPTASTLTGTGMFLPAANTLGFSTNGTNRMTLDASGNLGLGVTPSAWATTSSYLALQVGSSGIYGRSAASNETYLTSNTYYNAGWKYIYSASATRYDQESGIHSWYNAASGTAGNPITFTQAMTLKSDSELQIAGTTDRGAYNLQVNGTGVWGEGAYVNGSDANIKENIVDLDSSLNIVNNLKPVIFNYINTSVNNDTKHLGFIAQDVYQILENKDYLNSIVRSDGETLSIAYSNLIPLLTKAIQEQNAIIKALEQRILILENK